MANLFGTDRVLLYDVDPWNRMGFGCPNFGENIGTLSLPLAHLADEIGKMQLFIMSHVDAQRTQPPSLNTVIRMGRMLNRIQSKFAGRLKEYNELRVEAGHATPDQHIWTIHPVPYFPGSYVRNHWLEEYNGLTMIALANIMQHSDNNIPLTITSALVKDVYVYFKEITKLLGIELLALPRDTVEAEGFLFLDEHYANYRPDNVTINIEALDNPGLVWSQPTEDNLKSHLDGYPANLIAPLLKQYPRGPVPGDLEGVAGADLIGIEDEAEGVTGGAVGPNNLHPGTSTTTGAEATRNDGSLSGLPNV